MMGPAMLDTVGRAGAENGLERSGEAGLWERKGGGLPLRRSLGRRARLAACSPFDPPFTAQGQVRAPPSLLWLGMWWVAPPCASELSLLAAGGCQVPSLAWLWAETYWGDFSPEHQAGCGSRWELLMLLEQVRGGGTQVPARGPKPTALRVLSLRTIIAPFPSERIFLLLPGGLGLRVGVPSERAAFWPWPRKGQVGDSRWPQYRCVC